MSDNHASPLGRVLGNPILVKCARSRLRMKHILSWGMVVLTVTAFIWIMSYVTATQRLEWTNADAAQATIVPLIIIQGLILMLLGTGSVASSLAREREGRLIDYQRMTPMTPVSKILGYLFGLPAREYFLFALTLPFLAIAVVMSGFSPVKLMQFYAVFFMSVWVYHMTGMTAGMASAKPWRAAMLSLGMVVMLYAALPQLAKLGFTFFEFLTIRPTFYGMIGDELRDPSTGMPPDIIAGMSQTRDVGFFGAMLHPTVYTMMVQGFLLCTLSVVVYRKWVNEKSHPFSKLFGFLFYTGVLIFTIGSVWPVVVNGEFYTQLPAELAGIPPPFRLYVMLLVTLLIAGGLGLLVIHLITPSANTSRLGRRRARKLGLDRVPANSDAASSLPVVVGMTLLTVIGFVVLVQQAGKSGHYFAELPSFDAWIMPVVLIAAMIFFLHGLRERFSSRMFFVTLFVLWVIPFFTALIFAAATEDEVLSTYIALPFPPAALMVVLLNFLDQAVPLAGQPQELMPSQEYGDHVPRFALLSTAFYVVLALLMQVQIFLQKQGHRMINGQPGVIDTSEVTATV